MPKKTTKPAAKSNAIPNKSEFIRTHGDVKPAELVAKGKEAGLDFKIEYVYAIRQAEKKKASKGKGKSTLTSAPGKKAGRNGNGAHHVSSGARHHEEALRRAVLDLGVSGVRSLLASIEHKFLAL